MRRVLAVGSLLAILLAASAFAAAPSRPPATVVTSSRLVKDGHIRITARFETPVVAGRPLQVSWRVRNVSKQPRKIQLAFESLWLVIHSADGTTYDTRKAFGGFSRPYVPPTKLRPGQTVSRSDPGIRVRWSGPLRITPGWDNAPLPRVAVGVEAPGASSARRAVAEVVATTGHLLDRCRPTRPGVVVTGRIDAPKHSAPPMATRCSVMIRREAGFDVAQVLITTPRARRAHVHWTYETVGLAGGRGGNAEAIAWQFVVTKNGATSVAAASVDVTKQARKMAPYWEWTSGGPGSRPGGSRCGGTGGGGGGFAGPGVLFVSICR